MGDNSSVKVKEMLTRHSELEQSETKAQAALVTILTLTQITELKLLLDIGRQGHRFYDFVLTLLIACISLEIFVGVVIIYVGNLHYYRAATKQEAEGWSPSSAEARQAARSPRRWIRCLAACCCQLCRRVTQRSPGPYQSVHEMNTSSIAVETPAGCVPSSGLPGAGPGGLSSTTSGLVAGLRRSMVTGAIETDDSALGGGSIERWSAGGFNTFAESFIGVERAEAAIELARVKVADAECRIVRAVGYVKIVDEALRKAPGARNSELEAELGRAKDELSEAERQKSESEAEQKLADALRRRALYVKDLKDDRQERATFQKVSFWQHGATYLLYFVMLMNVFITTFGISTGPTPLIVTSTVAAAPGRTAAPVGVEYIQSQPWSLSLVSTATTVVPKRNVSELLIAL